MPVVEVVNGEVGIEAVEKLAVGLLGREDSVKFVALVWDFDGVIATKATAIPRAARIAIETPRTIFPLNSDIVLTIPRL